MSYTNTRTDLNYTFLLASLRCTGVITSWRLRSLKLSCETIPTYPSGR